MLISECCGGLQCLKYECGCKDEDHSDPSLLRSSIITRQVFCRRLLWCHSVTDLWPLRRKTEFQTIGWNSDNKHLNILIMAKISVYLGLWCSQITLKISLQQSTSHSHSLSPPSLHTLTHSHTQGTAGRIQMLTKPAPPPPLLIAAGVNVYDLTERMKWNSNSGQEKSKKRRLSEWNVGTAVRLT